MDRGSSFDDALIGAVGRIIRQAAALGHGEPRDLPDSVRTLLMREAPEGMPLSWAVYLRRVAGSLGAGESDPERREGLRRVGAAIVEALDEGEVESL